GSEPGAGAVRDATRAGRVGSDSRPASIPRTRQVSDRDMMRGAWLVAVAATLAGVGACKQSKAGGPGAGGGGGMMGLPVEAAVARVDTVRDEIGATGQIEAVQSIDLHPEVEGRITEILVNEGQEVEKGTPL